MIEDKFETGELILRGTAYREPAKIHFTNSEVAQEIFNNAVAGIRGGTYKKILIHADVDFDGVASAFIADSVCRHAAGYNSTFTCINHERKHGATDKLVASVAGLNATNKVIGLVIIVDSSTNSLDVVRKIPCDVIILDHHELEIPVEETVGYTAGGRYVIINKEIDHIPDMSGAQVVYEWFRYIGFETFVKQNKLYSWVGVSLFSDIIDGDNASNQWFIHNIVDRGDYDYTLKTMFKAINRYAKGSKTDISFRLVPLINAAVRTGHSDKMLGIVMTQPEKILELQDYKAEQDKQTALAISDSGKAAHMLEYPDIVIYDTTGSDELVGYEGMIASKLMDEYMKTAIVFYRTEKGIKGSFRVTGRYTKCNLRQTLNEIEDITASGHSEAFGFESFDANSDVAITKLLNNVVSIADRAGIANSSRSARMDDDGTVIHEEDDIMYINVYSEAAMNRLIMSGEIAKIATINAHMSGRKKVMLRVPNVSDTVKVLKPEDDPSGKPKPSRLIELKVLGLSVITFDEYRENYGYVWLYPEINNGLNVYVDNVRP